MFFYFNKCVKQQHSQSILLYSICLVDESSAIGNRSKVFEQAENNLFKTCVLLVVFFFMSMSYSFVIYFLYYVDGDRFGYLFSGWNIQLSNLLVLCNSVCNPFIYTFRYTEFQMCFLDVINKLFQRHRS